LNTWERIDLWPKGPAGVEARWRRDGDTVYCFIGGSDHWIDWLHHVIPGAWKRELWAAQKIADIIADKNGLHNKSDGIKIVIGGHSLGGAIACIVAEFLLHEYWTIYELDLYTYGAKRLRWKTTAKGEHYRHRGDIVPYLPPWMPKYQDVKPYGSWMPFWKAHGPRTYYDLMVSHKLREAN
jgi:hypothetical protein